MIRGSHHGADRQKKQVGSGFVFIFLLTELTSGYRQFLKLRSPIAAGCDVRQNELDFVSVLVQGIRLKLDLQLVKDNWIY